MTYQEQLQDPRWEEKRKEIIYLAGNRCESCGKSMGDLQRMKPSRHLEVHHKYYDGRMAWDYLWTELVCLCNDCHELTEDALQGGRKLMADLDWKDVNAFVCDFHTAARRVGDRSALVRYICLAISDPGTIQRALRVIDAEEKKEAA